MIRVSTKGRYGVRFMMELASHFGRGAIPLHAVALRLGISEKYLWHLVPPLKDAGLIFASRGKRGGYVLAKHPGRIRLYEVLKALEGPVWLVKCVGKPSSCRRSRACAARWLWEKAGKGLASALSAVTLEQMTTIH